MTSSNLYTNCAFEAGFLNKPVWRLDNPSAVLDVVDLASQYNVGLISCRIQDGDAAGCLQEAGFYPVETLITLSKDIWPVNVIPENIRAAVPEDAQQCAEIGRVAFADDRFHKDPHISNDIADAIKSGWVENSVKGRADRVFVAETNGRIAGFNACFLKGDFAVIDLIGISPEYQGQGIGQGLLDMMASYYVNRAKSIKLGTQLSNTRSLRFYQKFGFRELSRSHTYHWVPNY